MKQRYRYYALNAHGSLISGLVRAANREQAELKLKDSYPSIALIESAGAASIRSFFSYRVSSIEILMFTKNLHVLLKAGITLDESLKLILQQKISKRLRRILKRIYESIQGGSSLANALHSFDSIFNPFFINMVYVGEQSGTLEQNLEYLSQEMEHNLELKRKILSASLYPAIILLAITVMGIIMIKFVLPQITGLFNSIHTGLPGSTRALLSLAHFLEQYAFTLLEALAILAVIIRFLLLLPTIKIWWQSAMLRIPIVGNLVKSYNVALAMRTLGTLLQAGTPVGEALATTAQATHNLLFKKLLLETKIKILQGSRLSEALDVTIFTALATQIIGVGERTGTLEHSLTYISEFYTNQLDTITKNIPTVLEPALLIIIGVTVAFVAFSILTPIFNFTSAIAH